MSSDVVIKVENIGKCYKIYRHPKDELKQFVLSRLYRTLHKSPPKYYREFWAAKDISFEVKQGEVLGIIGKNGSGKSTLLQLISGILAPTCGNVAICGKIATLLELSSGFNPMFSGLENIYLNAAVLGFTSSEIDKSLNDIIAFAEIGDCIDQPLKTYSSGMKLRLAFAVHTLLEPEILVVDEGLAVGDEKFRRKCFVRFEELKKRGTTILFVSHSESQILQLCDRAILLHNGEKLLDGIPQYILAGYQRLLYAPQQEQEKLAKKMSQDEKDGKANSHNKNGQLNENAETHVFVPADKDNLFLCSYYDASLSPTSTISYSGTSAKIINIEIYDNNDKKVNVINAKERCKIIVNVEFLEDCRDIYFGMNIQNISGVVITGQKFPSKHDTLYSFTKGNKVMITFFIGMRLLPGVYYIGSGVWSLNDANCLHRVIDMVMFKIMESSSPISEGYCDLMAQRPDVSLAD